VPAVEAWAWKGLARVDIRHGERATGRDVAADHADVFGDRAGAGEITAASLVPLMVTTTVEVVPSVERTVKVSVSVWPTPSA
jgi:hypothetical protein